MKVYTESFREEIVRRMMKPPGVSVARLSAETGVSKSALWKWKVAMGKKKAGGEKRWTADEKLRVLAGGAEPLAGEALGALLRREGLHEAEVAAWRDAAAGALSAEAAPGGASSASLRQEVSESRKRLKELERELHRKDKALAEAAALLLLEKKLQAMGWRSGATNSGQRSDE